MHITSEDDFLMAIEEHLISKEANAQNILFDLDVDTHLEQAKEPPSLQQNVRKRTCSIELKKNHNSGRISIF
jgi:hypothetical protein